METFNKVCRIGTIPTYGGSRVSVYVRIRCGEFGNDHLSFTGVIGPRPSGNCYGSCGQIDMGFDHRDKSQNDTRYSEPIRATAFRFAPGWGISKWYDLLEMWHTYHLKSDPLPQSVIDWVLNLPDTDKQPAWA